MEFANGVAVWSKTSTVDGAVRTERDRAISLDDQPVVVAADRQSAAPMLAFLRERGGTESEFWSPSQAETAADDGLHRFVLLVLCRAEDAAWAEPLVQLACLRKQKHWLLLVANKESGESADRLGRHLGRVFTWPDDRKALERAWSDPPSRDFPDASLFTPGTREHEIARRLLDQTPSLLPLVEKLALAAEHDVTVLLTGETGTGKTFLARLIHDVSPRAGLRFLTVPCGALSPNLVESEFFGHVKGAFTGADRAKVGKFAAAGEGTLLLDEVDALGLEQQANLLRVVETGEYEPVGSNETHHSRCRLIVASNKQLKDECDRGRFRRDLYFRLNVMSFHLPPLRERIEDIEPLARALAARFNRKFKKDLYDISSEAIAALESFPWPGNLRELENVMQQAVLMSQGPLLLLQHLPEEIRQHGQGETVAATAGDTLLRNRELAERAVIQRALASHGYSRAKAANELGISRVTLYKKMKKYGLMDLGRTKKNKAKSK